MKRFWVRHARVFTDVVEVARTAVRDIDWDDLPSALRPVAKYSGGTLPPPLAGALLDTLVTNDWFRAKVADVDGAGNGAVQAFLVQDPGWWEVVVERVLQASAFAGSADSKSLSAELVTVQSKLSEAKRRIASLRADLEVAATAHRTDEQVESLQHRSNNLERRLAESDEARAKAAAERDVATVIAETSRGERDDARAQARELRTELADLRRALGSGGVERNRTDPVLFARELDALVAMGVGVEPVRHTTDDSPDQLDRKPELSLPPGIRPDDSAAVVWLLANGDSASWIIDGYNLSFALGKAMDNPARARRELRQGLTRLSRKAAPTSSVVVVYDSAVQGDRDVISGKMFDVVFAPAHQTADDAIVERSGADRVIVVSNDRDVRERSEARGALAIWSDAVVAWLR
ncbi:MAG: NYN domain-containing protein [Acidobacteria bacterium]|nr:NYN domain-containing protein [Acidobacteriota bacterium]